MFVAVNKLVGVSFTVTVTLVNGEVHAGLPGFTTIKEIVFTPVLPQLIVCGPAPTGLPPLQPSHIQLYVAPPTAAPVYVSTVVPFVVDGLAHTLAGNAVNALVGVGTTVTKTVVVTDWQTGALLFTTVNVKVFVPMLFQLNVQGPAVLPGVPLHPSQLHV